jgi:hypothetical protein
VYQSLFNPDLVREALAGDPDGEVKRAAEFTSLDKVLDAGPPPAVAIEAIEAIPGIQAQERFLQTQHGQAFSDTGFYNWFTDKARRAGVPQGCCRTACARRAAAVWRRRDARRTRLCRSAVT